ncbi:MAG: LysM peptidoglycan-binding domain-containing protein [Burkholderiaceae bacterium]|nr:MAG: LysM peptidoglycan-binding domain-containing protein [Burkholderiaceae bacterium]
MLLIKKNLVLLCTLFVIFALSGCTSSSIFLIKDQPGITPNIKAGKSVNANDEDVDKKKTEKSADIKQEVKSRNIDVAANQNIFDEIKENFRLPSLSSKRVNRQVKVFTRNPQYLNRMFGRSKKYLHFIYSEVKARKLPSELALLPFVESAYNPHATSRANAAGLWQFIPATGRRYDLEQTWWSDERRTVIDSTLAALDYLEYLHKLKGGDWFHALASYNWGERSVRKAIERNKRARKKTNYSSLRMPRETRNYVPKLLAMREIVNNPSKYRIQIPTIPNTPYFKSFLIDNSLDVTLISKLAEIETDEFLALNANVLRPVVNKKYTKDILLPYDNYEIFKSNLRQYQKTQKNLVGWAPLKLEKSSTLRDIAEKYDNNAVTLAKANGIRSVKAKLLKGSSIIVAMNDKNASFKIEKFRKARLKFLYPDHMFYKVKKGDTLSHIADKYRVSVRKLKSLNNLRGSLIKVGQRLRIRNSDYGDTKNTHRVRKGESLYQIAKRYRTTVDELKRLNKLASDTIVSGSKLIIKN